MSKSIAIIGTLDTKGGDLLFGQASRRGAVLELRLCPGARADGPHRSRHPDRKNGSRDQHLEQRRADSTPQLTSALSHGSDRLGVLPQSLRRTTDRSGPRTAVPSRRPVQ